MAHVLLFAWLDGVMHHGEKLAPYNFPGDNGATVTPRLFGICTHGVASPTRLLDLSDRTPLVVFVMLALLRYATVGLALQGRECCTLPRRA